MLTPIISDWIIFVDFAILSLICHQDQFLSVKQWYIGEDAYDIVVWWQILITTGIQAKVPIYLSNVGVEEKEINNKNGDKNNIGKIFVA